VCESCQVVVSKKQKRAGSKQQNFSNSRNKNKRDVSSSSHSIKISFSGQMSADADELIPLNYG